jgi:acyl carrier protein
LSVAGAQERPAAIEWLLCEERWTEWPLPERTDWLAGIRAHARSLIGVVTADAHLFEAFAALTGALWAEAGCGPPMIKRLDFSRNLVDDGLPDVVFVLGKELAPLNSQDSVELDDINAVFEISRQLMAAAWDHAVGCFYMHSVAPAEDNCAAEAISGFVCSAVLENAQHGWTLLQCERQAGQASGLQLVLREWLAGEQEQGKVEVVRYRGQRREVRRLCEVPCAADENDVFRRNGHYLLVGGLGPVGELLCRELAVEFQARLSIFSRSSWSPSIKAQCEALRGLGAPDAHYWSVDITDEKALMAAIDGCRRQNGAIHGVIHLARLVEDALIVDKTWPAFLRSIAAKVQGTVNLDRATADQPLDFFALFSSFAAYGIRGSADYGYAAAFQNAHVRHRQRLQSRGLRKGTSVAYCWGAWTEDRYMPANRNRQLEELGLDLIDAKSAFAFLRQRRNTDVLSALAVADRALACRRLGIDVLPATLALEQIENDADCCRERIQSSGTIEGAAREAVRGRDLEVHLAEWERQRRDGTTVNPDQWSKVLSEYDIDELDETLIDRLEQVLFATESAKPDQETERHGRRTATTAEMTAQISEIISRVLMVKIPNIDEPLQRYGLDSVGAMQVASALSRKYGRIVEPKQLLQHRSVRLLAEYLAAFDLKAAN